MPNQQSIFHARRSTIEGPAMDVITTNQESGNSPAPSTAPSTNPTPTPAPTADTTTTTTTEPTPTQTTTVDTTDKEQANSSDMPAQQQAYAPHKDCKYCGVDKIMGLVLKGTGILALMALAYFLVTHNAAPKPSK